MSAGALTPGVLASMGAIAGAPLLGALVALTSQAIQGGDRLLSVAQHAAVAVLAALAAGFTLALVPLIRSRNPRDPAWLPLLVSAVLIGLVCHFRFYAFGFHQDRWAPL